MKRLVSAGITLLCILTLGSFAHPSLPDQVAARYQPSTAFDNDYCLATTLQQGGVQEMDEGDLILRGELLSAAQSPLEGYVVQLQALTRMVDETSTDIEGRFVFGNLSTGTYTLEVYDSDGVPVELSPASKSTVELEADTAIFPVLYTVEAKQAEAPAHSDITLAQAGVISGTVTAEDTGDPLEDVRVIVRTPSGEFVTSTSTDASGNYTVTGLDAGEYIVKFDPQNFSSVGDPAEAYLLEYYNDQPDQDSADPVTVTDPGTTSGIDAALERGSQISGTVTAEDGGAPLADVDVDIYDYCTLNRVADTETDSNGEYTTPGLPTGSYIVEFDPESFGASNRYSGEYYDDQATLLAADQINTTAPTDVTNIDAQTVSIHI